MFWRLAAVSLAHSKKRLPLLKMNISVKFLATAIGSVTLTAIIALLIQRQVIFQQGVDLIENTMRAVVVEAENVRDSVSALSRKKAFDTPALLAEMKHASSLKESTIYGTIPVVAAWNAIQTIADKEGYEFRIPKNQARNKKNLPTENESIILNYFEDGKQKEYFSIDRAANQIVYARPIVLTEDCLACHGDPKNSPTGNGEDILGFKMENWKAGEVHGAFVLRSNLDRLDKVVQAGVMKALWWICPIVLLIGVGVAVFIRRSITQPLEKAIGVVRQVAAGDLTTVIEIDSTDEIGQMMQSLSNMTENLRGVVGKITQASSNVASGSSEMSATSQQISEGASEQSAAAEETTPRAPFRKRTRPTRPGAAPSPSSPPTPTTCSARRPWNPCSCCGGRPGTRRTGRWGGRPSARLPNSRRSSGLPTVGAGPNGAAPLPPWTLCWLSLLATGTLWTPFGWRKP